MPVLSLFYGLIIRMYKEVTGKDHKPHIHAEYAGDFLINGGFAVGNASASGSGAGWSASYSPSITGFILTVDYVLEKYALTVGGETGYISDSLFGGAIPLMFRLGYHPDFSVKNLDVYGLAKLGIAIGTFDDSQFGFGFGLGIGVRYFFIEQLAGFAELGYDRYSFSGSGFSVTAAKIFTIGLTYKHIKN
jgi:hypothetical protein